MKTVTVNAYKLTGLALDWAVAQAEGRKVRLGHSKRSLWIGRTEWSPSTNGRTCMALLEKHRAQVRSAGQGDQQHWRAEHPDHMPYLQGQNPMIAICRAIVRARLGDEIQVPEELIEVVP